jgi:hypothetical protein
MSVNDAGFESTPISPNLLQNFSKAGDVDKTSLSQVGKQILGSKPTISQMTQLVKSSLISVKDKTWSSPATRTTMRIGIKALKELSTDKQATAEEKAAISGYLTKVEKIQKTMNRNLLIREASVRNPEKSEFIASDDFKKRFGALCTLYGDSREMDPKLIDHFIEFCGDPDAIRLFDQFQRVMHKAKVENLALVNKGELPTTDKQHNIDLAQIALEMKVFINLTIGEYKDLEPLFGDITSRSCLRNSQEHTDSIGLALNSEATTGTEGRYKEAQEAALEKGLPEGFIAKADSQFMYQATWNPPLTLGNPITPIVRSIAYETKEGHRAEVKATLDLSFLNNPTSEQREQITAILKLCDQEITKDPQWLKKLQKGDVKLPKEMAEKLTAIDWLSEDQKMSLVHEGARFAKEVNLQMWEKSLKLV